MDDHVKEIKLHDENEKQKLIELLYKSESFQTTHGVIAMLKQHTGWTEQQIEKMCSALIENSQVNRIVTDPDVNNYYHSLLSTIDDEGNNDIVNKAVKLIKDY